MKFGRIIGIGLLALIGMNGCSDSDSPGKKSYEEVQSYPVVNYGVRIHRNITGRLVNEKTKKELVFIALDHDSSNAGIEEVVEISISQATSENPGVLIPLYLNEMLPDGRVKIFSNSSFTGKPYFKGHHDLMSDEQKRVYNAADSGLILQGYDFEEVTRKSLDRF